MKWIIRVFLFLMIFMGLAKAEQSMSIPIELTFGNETFIDTVQIQWKDGNSNNEKIQGTIQVRYSDIAVREGPGTNYEIVRRAQYGDIYTYTDYVNGWYKLSDGSYINGAYVSTSIDYSDAQAYRYGDVAPMVAVIQEWLKTLKYYDGDVTGHYGSKTAEAVAAFQRDNGLTDDGVAGKRTIAAIQAKIDGSSGNVDYSGTIYNVDWFTAKSSTDVYGFTSIGFVANNYAKLTDLTTETSLRIKIQSTGNHIDAEPVTAADTAKFCTIYGVSYSSSITSSKNYQRRPMMIEIEKTGFKAICSMYGVPHGKQTILDNNFPGQFCLHFYNSKTSGTNKVDSGHMAAINRAKTIVESKTNKTVNLVPWNSDSSNQEVEIKGTIEVKDTDVAVREGPGTSYEIMRRAQLGDIYPYTGYENGWYKLSDGYYIHESAVSAAVEWATDDYNTYITDFQVGDTDPRIATIQVWLKTLKYFDGDVTGYFGDSTAEAVAAFQRDNNMTEDGIADARTIVALQTTAARESSGKVDFSGTIHSVDWFSAKSSDGNYGFSKIGFVADNYAKLTDLSTGISLRIKIQSTNNHIDAEPVTASDTEKFCAIYGVFSASSFISSKHYQRRPMMIEIEKTKFKAVCSMYGVPHGQQTILDNNFNGQFCLHFYNSKTSGTEKVDSGHQTAITKAETIVKNNGNTVILVP